MTNKVKFEIARMEKGIGLGKIIAVFYDNAEAKAYVEAMNKLNGKKYEYFIW